MSGTIPADIPSDLARDAVALIRAVYEADFDAADTIIRHTDDAGALARFVTVMFVSESIDPREAVMTLADIERTQAELRNSA